MTDKPDNDHIVWPVAWAGMTLRDYFAGQALVASSTKPITATSQKALAKYCYAMADAMMAERKR